MARRINAAKFVSKTHNYRIRIINGLEYWNAKSNKFVFFDVPKVASTAIKISLGFGNSAWGLGEKWNYSYKRYYTIAFVRHPFDRVLSAFCMYNKHLFDNNEDDLNGFISNLITEKNVNDPWGWHLTVRPLCSFMPIFNNKPEIDFVGRFEHLERDWNVLRNRFDFPELTAKSKQNHITNHSLKLTKVQADKLKPIYEWDFKIFGYNSTDFVSSPT